MIKELRELIGAQPFVPFTIHTASGAQLRVPTDNHVAISPTGGRVVVFKDDGTPILVSAMLIGYIAVDPGSEASAAA